MNEPLGQNEVLQHYGYDPEEAAPGLGLWKNDGSAIDRLGQLPEVIRLFGKETPKIRIVFDYDPDFPRALFQAWGLPQATLLPVQNTPEAPGGQTESLR